MSPSLVERALLVKFFYLNQCNASAALRAFRKHKKMRKGNGPLSVNGLKAMVAKFEKTGSLKVQSGRGRKPVPQDTIEAVATAIVDRGQDNIAATSSARGVARNMDMPYSTVWKIVRKIIHFYPYKISRVQELLYTDHDKRLTFALTFLARMEVDDAWPWKILWGDEAHFYLNGTVNTQNCRIWDDKSPHAVTAIPLHSPKVTVWCGFTAEFIVGPFFYENITPTGPVTCSVTGEKYRHMLNSFVIPALQQRQCLGEIIFMQDGAPPHVAVRVQQLLRQKFTTERVISRCFPTPWPPRSPDLTPCDFWLWGYLKSKVYQGVVQDLATLKDNISRTVREIPADMLLSAVVHTVHRMQYVVHNNGSHIEPHLNAK